MRLENEFTRLPVTFDVTQLRHELSQIGFDELITHPQDRTNLAALLVSVNGTTNDDFAIAGEMRPTATLLRSGYLQQVLGAFDTEISRSRLMILPPGASVPEHDDVCYHWYRRTRIHVPIITNEQVKFYCADKCVHMAAGEAWVFDNFLPHRVVNNGSTTRVHLVADTRGSDAFWELVRQGQNPFALRGEARPARFVPYAPDVPAVIRFEPYLFEVLQPAEVMSLAAVIVDEATSQCAPDQAARVSQVIGAAVDEWAATFARHGHSESGAELYASILSRLWDALESLNISAWMRRRSDADQAVRVLCSVCIKGNRKISYAPDLELAQVALRDMTHQAVDTRPMAADAR